MRRDCNLELRLVPPSPFHHRQGNPSDGINMVGRDLKEKQNQQLTIFYDGKISVCDVTELQAMTILKLASEEMDDKGRRTPASSPSSAPLMSDMKWRRTPASTSSSPSSSPLMSDMKWRTPASTSSSPLTTAGNQGGLSMKRSLQRFLQKRKHRIQETCPYHP